MTTALTFKIQLLEKKGRNNTFVEWTSHCIELTPCCFEPSNSTESKHNILPLHCGYCKGYWTSQVHTFWRGAQQESMTDKLTLFSTRLYDFILFNSRYFMHFDDWRACLWVSKWWERSLFRWISSSNWRASLCHVPATNIIMTVSNSKHK